MLKSPEPTSPAATARSWQVWLVAGLIGLGALALFWPATHFEFLNLDDDLYVHANSHVKDGLTVRELTYALTTTDGGNWMPLTWLSYLVDAQLWGFRASGFHATNLLLHAAAAVLLFLALHRMTQVLWASAFAAALFALHPLRLESVVWIAERKDVLSGVAFMLTLLAYARYAARPSRARMVATCVCLSLGLMAKPMLVTIPFLLLLLDVWPLRRMQPAWPAMRLKLPGLLREKIPLFAVSLVFVVVTWRAQTAAGAITAPGDGAESKILRLADNYGFYLRKFFWPDALNVLYPTIPVSAARSFAVILSMIAVSFAVWRWRRQQPWLMVGWLWFVGLLVPVIGVVPIGSTWVADRYSYLPGIGLAVLGAWMLQTWSNRKLGSIASAAIAMFLLSALAFATVKNLSRWRNSIALFTDSVSCGEHPGAHHNLGVALMDQGDPAAALPHFTRALELSPRMAEAFYNRGNARRSLGEAEAARADYTRALELKPAYAEAFNNRGSLFAAAGQWENALGDFTQAIKVRADYSEALANRGHVYLELGKFAEAITDYSRAVALQPDFAAAFHDRAVARYQMKDYRGAWEDVRQCRRLGTTPSPELLRRLEADSGQRE